MKKILIVSLVAILLCLSICTFVSCDNQDDMFSETKTFAIDKDATNIMDIVTGNMLGIVENIALNGDNTYVEFYKDGTMHAQIQTKAGLFSNIAPILTLVGVSKEVVEEMLSTFYIGDMLNSYVEPMFPGFVARVQNADLKGALGLIKQSLGFDVVGLDYDDEGVKSALEYIGDTMYLPSNLLEIIPKDTVLTLTLDTEYSIRKAVGNDGKVYNAIYLGKEVKENPCTQPFAIFTMNEDDGNLSLILRIEFMNIDLGLKEVVKA